MMKGVGFLNRIQYFLINEGIQLLDSSSGRCAMKEN